MIDLIAVSEAYREWLAWVCLRGLVLLSAALALRWLVNAASGPVLGLWRKLTFAGRVAVCSLFGFGVIDAGTKTNPPPSRVVGPSLAVVVSADDVAAVGALDFATIRVTCDGPSDLGDHVIIARTNQVCHVPLLAGATYAVESDLPIAYSAVSSEHAHIVTNSTTELTVSMPIEISFERIHMRSDGVVGDALTIDYTLQSTPVDVGASLTSISGGCCLCETNEIGFTWVCSENCSCGAEHLMSCMTVWEGYIRTLSWWGACSCVSDDLESNSYIGDGISLSLNMPSTFISNDDDDNDNGVVDATPPFGNYEDEVITGRVSFASTTPTNGILKLQMLVGLEQGTNGVRRVYEDESGMYPIDEGYECVVAGERSKTWDFFINPVVPSSRYMDGHVRALWRSTSGSRVAAGKRFTVIEPTVEPICEESWSVADFAGDGRLHSYLYNPCAVVAGQTAKFKIDVLPVDYPDSEITWVTNGMGSIDFVGENSNRGRIVAVTGVSTGEVDMAIYFGEAKSIMPQFKLKVLESKIVKLRAWVIGRASVWCRTADEIRNMVAEANDVYAQVGVSLQLVEPIVFTNIPAAYDLALNEPNASQWSMGQLTSLTNGTDGLECYFVNSISGSPPLDGANHGQGMVLATTADGITLAHEIGHAFNLRDIYVSNESFTNSTVSLKALDKDEKAKANHMPWDWNFGGIGHGDGGVRFYGKGMNMRTIIDRMLMNGMRTHGGGPRDITFGGVYGVWYNGSAGNDDDWDVGIVPVGIFTDGHPSRNPVHQ